MTNFMINNTVFDYPDNFRMEREDNIVSSFVTLSGRVVGDVRGWSYKDNTLSWSYLTTAQINTLLSATSAEFTITFEDIDGTQHTINASRKGIKYGKGFRFINGNACFTDIEMGVYYPDVYDN